MSDLDRNWLIWIAAIFVGWMLGGQAGAQLVFMSGLWLFAGLAVLLVVAIIVTATWRYIWVVAMIALIAWGCGAHHG